MVVLEWEANRDRLLSPCQLSNNRPEAPVPVVFQKVILKVIVHANFLLDNPLAMLANNPMFGQLRAAVQQNPMLLQPILSQLAQTNPQMFQLISQNQEAFLKLLLEGGGEGGGRNLFLYELLITRNSWRSTRRLWRPRRRFLTTWNYSRHNGGKSCH